MACAVAFCTMSPMPDFRPGLAACWLVAAGAAGDDVSEVAAAVSLWREARASALLARPPVLRHIFVRNGA